MSTTVFLRFPDAATFTALLPAGAQAVGESFDVLPDGVQAISVLGDGGVIAPGYLVNLLCPQDESGAAIVPAAFAAYVTNPSTPTRMFG